MYVEETRRRCSRGASDASVHAYSERVPADKRAREERSRRGAAGREETRRSFHLSLLEISLKFMNRTRLAPLSPRWSLSFARYEEAARGNIHRHWTDGKEKREKEGEREIERQRTDERGKEAKEMERAGEERRRARRQLWIIQGTSNCARQNSVYSWKLSSRLLRQPGKNFCNSRKTYRLFYRCATHPPRAYTRRVVSPEVSAEPAYSQFSYCRSSARVSLSVAESCELRSPLVVWFPLEFAARCVCCCSSLRL